MGLTDYVAGSAVGQAVEGGAASVFNTISSVQNYINGVTGSYVISPYGMKGIAGFVFDYDGDDEQRFESDIPDHYSENNQAVQDHIANRPPKIVFYASDVAQTRALLIQRGLKQAGPVKSAGRFELCDCRDPDGNPFQISSRT